MPADPLDALRLPIVPVGIRGTRAVQRKGVWTIRPGKVVITYGAPIDCAAYGVRLEYDWWDMDGVDVSAVMLGAFYGF